MRRPRVCLGTLALLSCLPVLHARERTGTVLYRAEDNLDLREGTLELWLRVPFDVREHLPSGKEYKGLLTVAELVSRSGSLGLIYFAGAMHRPEAGFYCSVGSKEVELHGISFGRFILEPNEWHHLALTWKGCVLRAYLDGQLCSERTCPELLHVALGPVGAEPLRLGDKWEANGRMVIDELRVSSVAREPHELGAHGKMAADPYTRILDPFETAFDPDGTKCTQPQVMFAGQGGLPSRYCEFVEGRFGAGLALFRAAVRQGDTAP